MVIRKGFALFAVLIALVSGCALGTHGATGPLDLAPIENGVAAGPFQYGDHEDQSVVVRYDPDGPPRAAMIQISSGGWNSGRITKTPEIPELYRKLGMASVGISHRSIQDFQHPAQIQDVQAAIKYVKDHAKEWNIDPDRLAVTGRSSGGHLTMMAAFHPDSPRVKCAVQRSGPSDLTFEFTKNVNPAFKELHHFKMLFGEKVASNPQELAKKLEEFSPVSFMSPDDPPVLFAASYTLPSEEQPPNPNYGKHHHLFAVHGYERYKADGGVSHLYITMGASGRGGSGDDKVEEMFLRKYLLDQDVALNIPQWNEPAAKSAGEMAPARGARQPNPTGRGGR
jgi:acetyl esterase/lipase